MRPSTAPSPREPLWSGRSRTNFTATAVTDPFGHSWTVSTHIEDVSEEEMQRRMAQFTQQAEQAPA